MHDKLHSISPKPGMFSETVSQLWVDKTFILITVILFKHEISTFLIFTFAF